MHPYNSDEVARDEGLSGAVREALADPMVQALLVSDRVDPRDVADLSKLAGILGALGSTGTFLATVTVIPFMPEGWDAGAGGFPAMTGNILFLMKDVVLLAVSLYLLKQDVPRSLEASSGKAAHPRRTNALRVSRMLRTPRWSPATKRRSPASSR